MEQDWIKIRTYTSEINAEMDKQLLEANHIGAVVMNKQDSSLKFGRIELYVLRDMYERAIAVLTELSEGEK